MLGRKSAADKSLSGFLKSNPLQIKETTSFMRRYGREGDGPGEAEPIFGTTV